jgi:hypothetical protein
MIAFNEIERNANEAVVGFFRKLLGSHMNEKRSWDSSGSVT